MQNLSTMTVREIALEMPQTTRVFEQFKIDYCCGGRKPIAEACERAGVDSKDVIEQLEALFTSGVPLTTGSATPRSTSLSRTSLISITFSRRTSFGALPR